jgi:PASTA domain
MRLGTLLPRAVVIALAWVLGTAAFTFAADKTQMIGSTPKPDPAAAQAPELTVPSVTGQAFVFAKGMLEDSGFAWRVTGPVHGYAGNQVMAQSPAAGTRVVDTGAPTVVLNLVRGKYAENGTPEDTPSYTGTAIKLAGVTEPAAPKVKPAKKHVAKKHVAKKPVAKKPVAKKQKPAKKQQPAAKAKPPAKRPPAFVLPRAPKEPLDEVTLTTRADQLAAWIDSHPRRTNRNVQRWLYQHSWLVTGAQFGWWHGEEALVKLIAVDQKVQRIWGIGHRSEKVARAALAKVRRQEK